MLAGRAQLYGLAAADGADVRHCIDILARELRMIMHLCSARIIAGLNRGMIRSRRLVSGLQPGEGALDIWRSPASARRRPGQAHPRRDRAASSSSDRRARRRTPHARHYVTGLPRLRRRGLWLEDASTARLAAEASATLLVSDQVAGQAAWPAT